MKEEILKTYKSILITSTRVNFVKVYKQNQHVETAQNYEVKSKK